MRHSARSSARARLLRLLLDRYERSASYGRPGPWQRAVIVYLDERTFKEEWSPEGAEAREEILSAARDLAESGLAGIRYHSGFARNVPAQVRVGPEHVEAAYRAAVPLGFIPLGDVLSRVAEHAEELSTGPTMPEWLRTNLRAIATAARCGMVGIPGISSERLKEDLPAALDALTAAVGLVIGPGGMERVVSERLLGASKRLAEIRGIVRDLLVRADPYWEDGAPGAQEVLEHYGVRSKPTFLYCAGDICIVTPSGVRMLRDDVPSAAVAEGLVNALATALTGAGPITVTTIENETPYHLYVEESGGPIGLGRQREIVVYSGGFPSDLVRRFLRDVARGNPMASFRHWGDPDGGGLRIWWVIRSDVGREVTFFRTTPEWYEAASLREARVLSDSERSELNAVRCLALEVGSAPDALDAIRLIDTVLRVGRWVEQERFLK